MNNNFHKAESVKLLNGSMSTSESEVDVQFSMIPPAPSVNQTRRKVKTKRRSRALTSGGKTESSSPGLCSLFSVVKVAGVTFCVGGTIILTWLVLMLQSEVQMLTNRITSASYSSTNLTALMFENKHNIEQVVTNQTYTWNSIGNISDQLSVLTKQVLTLKNDFKEIRDGWKETAQVGKLGKELEELKSDLVVFQAEFSNFKNGIETQGGPSHTNFDELNRTLSSRIEWAVEDLHNHHNLITALQEGMRNLTQELPSTFNASQKFSESLSERVNKIHTMLGTLETKQRNSTLTIQYILGLLQNSENEKSTKAFHEQ